MEANHSSRFKRGKKITLADIAESLNVSKTLVSLVLNNKGDQNGISKETQRRVIEIAQRFDYKPNQLARGLRLGKTNTVGFIVADISNIFYSKLARMIEDELNKFGYNLIICSSDEKLDKEAKMIQFLRDKHVDGLIVSSTLNDSKIFNSLADEHYPFVLIDRHFPNLQANYVGVDNYSGSFQAVNKLISLGHKKIAILSISPSHISSVNERNEGYFDALKKAGIGTDNFLYCQIPFDNIKGGVDWAIKELLRSDQEISAIYTVNNNLALHCLETLRDLQISVPDQISLISFDDIEFFNFVSPSISAISQPLDEIANQAVRILMKEINHRDDDISKERVILPAKLVLRESVRSLAK